MDEETIPHSVAEEAEEAGATTAALLTADQVAERLGISTRRLRDWRKEGRITEVGRFKRGTARIPLFDPAEVARLQAGVEAGEAPVATVATVASADTFAEVVAQRVGLLLAERAEAEAATVAPLVALVREQQETIDDLRRQLAEAHSAPPAAPQPPSEEAARPASEDTPIAPGGAGGFWARLRRAFGGAG
jgi:DNA-binding transcriptional MerR regulator